jgi:dCMP deaminase
MRRPTQDEYLMGMAVAAARRGTCDRKLVGCLIASERGRVLETGYNGAPAGAPHCDEVGHLMYRDSCMRAVHAEANAVGYAARHGGPALAGGTAYVTTHPCPACMLLLITAGVVRIVYIEPYHEDADEVTRELAAASGIEVVEFNGSLWEVP